MTASPQDRTLSARTTTSFAVIVIAILFLTGFAQMFNRSFGRGDEDLYFYRLSVGMFNSAAVAPLYEQVADYLGKQDNATIPVRRWNLQVAYSNNYLLMNTTVHVASLGVRSFLSPINATYALYMSLSLALGVIAMALIAFAIFRWAVLAIDDSRWAAATALGIAAMLLTSLASFPPLDNFFGSAGWGMIDKPASAVRFSASAAGIWASITGLVKTFFVAGQEYSIFGYSPRSQVYLIGLGVFLLRWKGFIAASYALILVIALVHQSAASLMLLVFLCIDIALRPSRFNRVVIALVAAGFLLMARDTLLQTLNLWPVFIALAVLVALGAVIGFAARTRAPQLYHRVDDAILTPLRHWSEQRGPVASDLAAGGVLVIALMAIAIVMNVVGDAYSALVFWSWLPVRTMMIFQPAVFVAAAALLLRYLERYIVIDVQYLYRAALVVALCAAIPALYSASVHSEGLARSIYYNSRIATLAGAPLPRLDVQTCEAAFHYAIALEAETGQSVVAAMTK